MAHYLDPGGKSGDTAQHHSQMKLNCHSAKCSKGAADMIAIGNKRLFRGLEPSAIVPMACPEADIHAQDYICAHLERVANYAVRIAMELRLNRWELDTLYCAGLLHDIGKYYVPKQILLKPGKLTNAEWKIVCDHPAIAAEMLRSISVPQLVVSAVLHHHERYDGSGYPQGLLGDEIPLDARILAVADAFDSMTSHRPYRSMLTRERAIKELLRNAGSQFDPQVVDACVSLFSKVASKEVNRC
jgi:putative nucleotidyltransferase with HDIG domain